MKYKYLIETNSEFDNRAVHSDGSNMNAIFDKLLRITTKLTESCAGDMFWEGGVQWKEIDADDTITMDFHTRYLQVWNLRIPGGFDSGAEASLERILLVYRGTSRTEVIG